MSESKGGSIQGLIISSKMRAAVSTLPVIWAHSYHSFRIWRTIGIHLSSWNVGDIRSKKLGDQPHHIDSQTERQDLPHSKLVLGGRAVCLSYAEGNRQGDPHLTLGLIFEERVGFRE